MLVKADGLYTMTPEAKAFCVRLDNYFIKAKKKTDIQLMGKNFNDKIHTYREIFPAKKLPSGKPARNNEAPDVFKNCLLVKFNLGILQPHYFRTTHQRNEF